MNSATAYVNATALDCVADMPSVPNTSGLPVSMAKVGDSGIIVRISGRDDAKRFLKDLGFIPGTPVKTVAQAGGNIILDVRGSKIALDRSMANKVFFLPSS